MASGVRPMREMSRPRTPRFENRPETYEIKSSDDEGKFKSPGTGNGKPVQFGEPKKPLKVKEGKFHSGTTKSKPSLTALMSVVVISWFGRAEPQSDWLDWLGPWVESEAHHEPSESQ